MSRRGRYDVVFHESPKIIPHYCKEYIECDDGRMRMCHGKHPNHGSTYAEALKTVITYHEKELNKLDALLEQEEAGSPHQQNEDLQTLHQQK